MDNTYIKETTMPIVVQVIFDNEEVADNFLGWMSDGGGEWALMESSWEHVKRDLDFDYWTRDGHIIVTSSPIREGD